MAKTLILPSWNVRALSSNLIITLIPVCVKFDYIGLVEILSHKESKE